jgi:hypothetical protein
MKIEITKDVLFRFINSHSRLAQAEYHRDPSYNSSHFSHIVEEEMIKEVQSMGLMQEYLDFATGRKLK